MRWRRCATWWSPLTMPTVSAGCLLCPYPRVHCWAAFFGVVEPIDNANSELGVPLRCLLCPFPSTHCWAAFFGLVEPIDNANSELCSLCLANELCCSKCAPIHLPLLPPPLHFADLQGMGGLAPVVAFLGRQQPPALQARAAHLLGTAASNNNVSALALSGST